MAVFFSTFAQICGIWCKTFDKSDNMWYVVEKKRRMLMVKRKKIEYKSIRAKNSTHEQLVRISEETKIPILSLIEIAVPLLKEKYGIKE